MTRASNQFTEEEVEALAFMMEHLGNLGSDAAHEVRSHPGFMGVCRKVHSMAASVKRQQEKKT